MFVYKANLFALVPVLVVYLPHQHINPHQTGLNGLLIMGLSGYLPVGVHDELAYVICIDEHLLNLDTRGPDWADFASRMIKPVEEQRGRLCSISVGDWRCCELKPCSACGIQVGLVYPAYKNRNLSVVRCSLYLVCR